MGKRIIFHIDVNSAYLSWEAVYRLQRGESLDLRTVPSVVGGDEASRHGIVLAKSMSAKALYKIQTGESLFAVRQRAPNLIIAPPRYDLYMQCHKAMLSILEEYSPSIQIFSIDECFIDYTNMEAIWGPPLDAAHAIGKRIEKELGFTVNIGISSNKLLAKMGGDLKKPNMVHTLFPEEVRTKMWPLPVEDLYGVGRATAPKLYQMGIYTIGELANTDPELLKYKLKSYGQLIWDYANGIEESNGVKDSRPPIKGIGNSTTINFDVDNKYDAYKILLSLTEMVCMRLRQAGFCAQLVAVSIKTNEFKHYSHQKKFYTPTDHTTVIYESACRLFDESWKGEPIRHLGIRLSELCGNDFIQLSILEAHNEKKKKLDETIDNLRMKFGSKAAFRSVFLHSGIHPISGGVMEEEYQMMSSLL
ncbi:MAG: DNA polymerase IV [Bacillota bacterium]|nr:DNA polymerase IV [Bacillota bacterium]